MKLNFFLFLSAFLTAISSKEQCPENVVVSQAYSPACRNLGLIYGLTSDTSPSNSSHRTISSNNPCDFNEEEPSKQPKVTFDKVQQALEPSGTTSKNVLQQQHQVNFHVEVLKAQNPNDKIDEIIPLIPPQMIPGNELEVYHKHLKLTSTLISDSIGVYLGEASKEMTFRGLGVYFFKILPGIYVGNWSRGFKHGFGFNLRTCGRGFIAEGYEWEQGVPIFKWKMPTKLIQAIKRLDKCSFRGVYTLFDLLKLVPRSKLLETPEINNTELLNEDDEYSIHVVEDGRHLEIFAGKKDVNISLIPNSEKEDVAHGRFSITALGSNKYVLFPSHNLCYALAPHSDNATEGTTVVQMPYTANDPKFTWIVSKSTSDSITIKHEQSGLVMTSSAPGEFSISLSKYRNDPLQHFSFKKYLPPSLSSKESCSVIESGKIYLIRSVGENIYLVRDGRNVANGTKLGGAALVHEDSYNHHLFKTVNDNQIANTQDELWILEAVGISEKRVFGVPDFNKNPGIQMVLWNSDNGLNQRFTIVPVPDHVGNFMIGCPINKLFLKTSCSGKVTQEVVDEKNKDFWYQFYEANQSAELMDGKTYTIRSRNISGYVTVDGGNTSLKNTSEKTSAMKFIVKHLGKNVYIFKSVSFPNKALGFESDKSPLSVMDYNEQNEKIHWHVLKPPVDEFYRLESVSTGYYLTSNLNNSIGIAAPNGSTSQDFIISE